MFSFILHTNHSFPSFLFSRSLSPLLIYPSPIYSSSSSVQKRAGSDGNQQSMLYQVLGPEAGPSSSPCIKTRGGMGNRFPKASSCVGTGPDPGTRGPTNRPSYTTATHMQKAYVIPCRLPRLYLYISQAFLVEQNQ